MLTSCPCSLCVTDASKKEQLSLFSKSQPPKKRRKSRTAFTNQQIYELEKRFLYQKYLTPADRDEIAQTLGLSNAQVITWFQNRRAKLKRDLEEIKADVVAAKTGDSPSASPSRLESPLETSHNAPQLAMQKDMGDLYSKHKLSPDSNSILSQPPSAAGSPCGSSSTQTSHYVTSVLGNLKSDRDRCGSASPHTLTEHDHRLASPRVRGQSRSPQLSPGNHNNHDSDDSASHSAKSPQMALAHSPASPHSATSSSE